MTKFIKSISISLLWLSWLIFIAHMIIPHDHCLADSFTKKEDSCPASRGTTGQPPIFPFHCHAFNDFTSEKAIIYAIPKYIQPNNLSTGCCRDAIVFNLPFSGITITDNSEPVLESYLPGLSQLRAPPSLI